MIDTKRMREQARTADPNFPIVSGRMLTAYADEIDLLRANLARLRAPDAPTAQDDLDSATAYGNDLTRCMETIATICHQSTATDARKLTLIESVVMGADVQSAADARLRERVGRIRAIVMRHGTGGITTEDMLTMLDDALNSALAATPAPARQDAADEG